jgi:hypothetical protein
MSMRTPKTSARATRKPAGKPSKQYMTDAQFAELMDSASEALAYVRGLPNKCRVTVRSAPAAGLAPRRCGGLFLF